MQTQLTPLEWENLYLPKLVAYENALELSLEPYVQDNQLFVNLTYLQQWQLRDYLLGQRNYLELYNPTAEWFVQNNLPRYMEKLTEMKNNIDSVLSLILLQMDNQFSHPLSPPFSPSQPDSFPAQTYSPSSAQQAETNKKMLEIMADSQKASFEHFEKMHAMQEEMTNSINRFSV